MRRAKRLKDEIAGKAKRLAGEVLGDQALHDEGKRQELKYKEQHDSEDIEDAGTAKPLGNLDRLT